MEVELGKLGQEGSSTNFLESQVSSFCFCLHLYLPTFFSSTYEASEVLAITSVGRPMGRPRQEGTENGFLSAGSPIQHFVLHLGLILHYISNLYS